MDKSRHVPPARPVKPYLQKLPNELLERILFWALDASTLANLALTFCRIFSVFKRVEDEIVRTVLLSCVGVSVLHEATLALECTPPLRNDPISLQSYRSSAQIDEQFEDHAWIVHLDVHSRNAWKETIKAKIYDDDGCCAV